MPRGSKVNKGEASHRDSLGKRAKKKTKQKLLDDESKQSKQNGRSNKVVQRWGRSVEKSSEKSWNDVNSDQTLPSKDRTPTERVKTRSRKDLTENTTQVTFVEEGEEVDFQLEAPKHQFDSEMDTATNSDSEMDDQDLTHMNDSELEDDDGEIRDEDDAMNYEESDDGQISLNNNAMIDRKAQIFEEENTTSDEEEDHLVQEFRRLQNLMIRKGYIRDKKRSPSKSKKKRGRELTGDIESMCHGCRQLYGSAAGFSCYSGRSGITSMRTGSARP